MPTNDREAAIGKTIVITGAFSYTGKYTTRLLLDRGYTVRTLTNHPNRPNPFGDRVQAFPLDFQNPQQLTESLRGATALINTYWVRFPHGSATYESAVRNASTLFRAAADAGVERIVHVSIAKNALDSPLPYYRGKAQLEQALRETGVPHDILRPTVIFGREDILINNIAWFIRRFPAFGVPGDGRYRIRPIYVEDMAQLLAGGVERTGNVVTNAVGPEMFTFDDLIMQIAKLIRRPGRRVHMPMAAAWLSTTMMGWFVRDKIITWEEYKGLMYDLLGVDGPATGPTRLSDWIAAHRDEVGQRYASEVARHFTAPSSAANPGAAPA